ncbi:hypothetical protein JW979_11710 [bacterium]|nr:hypothetical protein [candidate division CSSED10-310 bacterium]
MTSQSKLALGSVLAVMGALGMVLSLVLGWSEAPRPWSFIVGFFVGLFMGLGVTLSIAGLIERRSDQ